MSGVLSDLDGFGMIWNLVVFFFVFMGWLLLVGHEFCIAGGLNKENDIGTTPLG